MSEASAVVCTEEVADALAGGEPVVALESTILAHGFPAGERRQLASDLEDAVRASGAIPATVAVIDGAVRVGLDADGLDLITDDRLEIAKAAALDLSVYLARRLPAATTVSATVFAARTAGIRFFATGGIGGVHRGDSGDVSSDLLELARSPIAVVSAGAKAILDLPRTLETLETLGALVLGYGTDEFPAFYVRTSGLELAHRCDSPAEIAAIAWHRFERLGQGGILVCNPLSESDALDADEMRLLIDDAIAAADAQGRRGKALTPFLLAYLSSTTEGRAVVANRSLALGNARLAAQSAVHYARR